MATLFRLWLRTPLRSGLSRIPDTIARCNPDNRPEAKLTGVLVWRNPWHDEEMSAMATHGYEGATVDSQEDDFRGAGPHSSVAGKSTFTLQ